MKKEYFIIGLIILFNSCNETQYSYTANFTKGNVKLVLSNNIDYVKYNDTIPVKFYLHKIKLNEIMIVAPGLEINARNDSLIAGKLLIKNGYKKYGPIRNDTFFIKVYVLQQNKKYKTVDIPIRVKN